MQTLLQKLSEEYTCPIRRIPIIDPVLTMDGHTYERQAITSWLKKSQKSPVTGLNLPSLNLIPNTSLKNLISKISILIPLQLKRIQTLKQKNEKLTRKLQQTNQQITYLKQLNTSKQMFLNESFKQLKRHQLLLEQKFNQIKEKNAMIEKLEDKLLFIKGKLQLQSKSLQTQKKSKQNRALQYQQKLLNQQKKNKQNIQSISNNYERCLSSLDQSTKTILIVLSVVMHDLFELIQKFSKQSSQQLRDEMIKIQQNLQKRMKSNYTTDRLMYYNIYKFLVQYFSIQKIINNRLLICPKIYFDSGQYYRICQVINIRGLFEIQQRIQNTQQTQKTKQRYNRFRYRITGIQNSRLDHINDECWQKVLKYAQLYENITSIVLQNSYMKTLRKKDLKRFPKLKYLNLSDNRLDEESIKQIQSYKMQTNKVVIVLDQVQHFQLQDQNDEEE